MLSKDTQKVNAIANLDKIGGYKPYTKAFKHGTVTMYEGFGGYYIEDDFLLDKIKEVEEAYGGTVYAVIHQITNIGELYTMLWSTAYEEDASLGVVPYGDGTYGVMAYVWNKSDDFCSEFGEVIIKPALGGLVRVA